jgi:CubicO group peptidase (beta-lactamase class C family)
MTPVAWVLLAGGLILACGDRKADAPRPPAAGRRSAAPAAPAVPAPEAPPVAAVEVPASEPAPSEPPLDLTTVEGRIAAVERQLQPAVRIRGRPTGPMQLADRMKAYRVQGVSIAVINDHQIEWARGYGLADADSRVPVDTGTLFQAGSISKPVAATGCRTRSSSSIATFADGRRAGNSRRTSTPGTTRSRFGRS